MPRGLSLASVALAWAAALLCPPAADAQDRTHQWPTTGWSTSSPEAQGMSAESLARLVDFGVFQAMDSLLVTRHGRIVVEATYAPFRDGTKHRVNSVTKSVVASLVAIALRDGLLDSLDRKVVDFFPDRTIADLDARKKAMTLRHLLDMTSGLDWSEPFGGVPESFLAMESSADWQQFVLDRPMAAAPGTLFNYASGNSHLLSAILSKVTGRSALDYARATLFGPLGIDDVLWRHDPQGVSAGGAGLYLQPRDLAKIGLLYLRDGVWEGRQILPGQWIAGVRSASGEIRASWAAALRYGSQFWVMPGRDAYMAVGHHHQLMIVMPKLDLVAVVTSSARFPPLGGAPAGPRYSFETLLGYLAAAVKSDGPLAPDPTAMALLADRLRGVAIEQPGRVGGSPATAESISGKTYRFARNRLNLKSVTFRLDQPEPAFEYAQDTPPPGVPAGPFGGPIGLDGHTRVGGRMPYGTCVARGHWLDDGITFQLEVQTLGNDDVARVNHVFKGNKVTLSHESAGGLSTLLEGTADD